MMRNKRNSIRYNNPVQPVKEPTSMYWENDVRFSLRSCSIDKNFCISQLGKNELLRLYKTLQHFEQMKFKTLDTLPREKGLTTEITDTPSYNLLKTRFPLYSNFSHFRVDGTDKPFRVFCAKINNLLCLLLFDRTGSIHHK